MVGDGVPELGQFPGDADKLFPGWREKLGVKAA